jgi:hypothetical protein
MTRTYPAQIQTRSGAYLNFLNPDPNTMFIDDIAHALAQINRFAGHSKFPYSVAQHSILSSRIAPVGMKLYALMHDAHEAYVVDVPSPLKALLPDYHAIEDRVQDVLRDRFGLPRTFDPLVKTIDRRMLATEARALGLTWWRELDDAPYDDMVIEPWTWQQARHEFLYEFRKLRHSRA